MNESKDHPGLCECGCGQRTSIATHSNTARGIRKGQHVRFISGHNMTTRRITETDYAVEDRGFQTTCWIWQGSLKVDGRGRVTISGRNELAHRAMYEQEVGPIPDGLELDHLCGVPPCIRPSHLEPVTHIENVRRAQATRTRKLTPEDVAEIRVLYEAGGIAQKMLGERFGVSTSLIARYVWDIAPHPLG